MAYREIEITLGISGTILHLILHEHLSVKKQLFALKPTQFVNRSKKKKAHVDWPKKYVPYQDFCQPLYLLFMNDFVFIIDNDKKMKRKETQIIIKKKT